MNANPVSQLDHSYKRVLDIAHKIPVHQWHQQFHPDLSPVGWHLGHCVFIESYWLQNKLANNSKIGDDLKNLYLPWLSPKEERAKRIPATKNLIKILAAQHQNNLNILNIFIDKESNHKLLKNNYLPEFLAQHYYQHIETLHQIILCIALSGGQSRNRNPATLTPTSPTLPARFFATTQTSVGATGKNFAYDNEMSRHEENVHNFLIAEHAVTNSEYLGFMETGGYRNKSFWSKHGWRWLDNHSDINAPMHWQKDANNEWYCYEHGSPENIKPEATVYGINLHEAEAFSRYAGCRLPTEIEWEHAATSDSNRIAAGQAWEWCSNFFYPYPGFVAHPYKNYSSTSFDNQHHTLRGGSVYTAPELKRPTFRNFYTPEKRHVFAGVRLVKSA